jgi:ribonuclease-3
MTNYITEGYKFINNDGEEDIIQIPYNINNNLPTEEDIKKLLEHFNIKLEKINIKYFINAFTHKSYLKNRIYPIEILEASKKELGNPENLVELQEKSYERLEYLGDRVLKLIVSNYLFHRYPNENEGFMTKLQAKIEDKKNLAIMSKEIGLGKFFIISKQTENNNGRNMEKIHEDVFEAFLGALYLSSGFEPCVLLVINLLETLIDYSDKLYCDTNYKDTLLKFYHSNNWSHPKYEVIYQEGPPNKRKYIIGVQKPNINNDTKKNERFAGFGIGNSYKEGEQNSAKMALIIYAVFKDDQYDQSDIYYPPWDKIENGENNILQTLNININKNDDDNISVYSEKSV